MVRYYTPDCGWAHLSRTKLFWIVPQLDADNGFKLSSTYAAYQRSLAADVVAMTTALTQAADIQLGEFKCAAGEARTQFFWRALFVAWLQRGIELRRCQGQVQSLNEQIKALQAQLPCPPPKPCPAPTPCPVCKEPPPCPTCPVCRDCPPPEPCPEPQQMQQQPVQPQQQVVAEKASWGVSLGWLAGGALAGAGAMYFLKARKR